MSVYWEILCKVRRDVGAILVMDGTVAIVTIGDEMISSEVAAVWEVVDVV